MNTISINKTARYTDTNNYNDADKLLIVLHGYGQLPYYFIRKFEELTSLGYYIIAPEGLHRFYLNGTSGRVGASWMTKEGRLDDIKDNISYLNCLYKSVNHDDKFSKKIILGFSQGGATASRWVNTNNILFDQCILWASVFPEDVPFPEKSNETLKYDFVVGTNDQYFSKDDIVVCINKYKESGINSHVFNGIHDIDMHILKQVIA